MQESTEPSLTKPEASEAQCDPANRAHSESRKFSPQSVVPADFVEIYRIPKPDSPDKEEQPEETAEQSEDEIEDEPDDQATSHGEQQTTGEGTPYQQEQNTPKKEPLPSEITYAEMRQAADRGDMSKASDLVYKFSEQRHAEQRAEKLAQALAAEKHRQTYDDSVDEDDCAEEEQFEPQPDQFGITIGGSPAKTAHLTDMDDLIRRNEVIEAVQYVSAEDGIINQISSRLRKNGLRDLDSSSLRDFVIREGFWLHPLVSRGFIFGPASTLRPRLTSLESPDSSCGLSCRPPPRR